MSPTSILAEAAATVILALPGACVQLLLLALLALVSWLPGRWACGSLPFADRAEAFALPAAVGLAVYGTVFLLLARSELFGPLAVACVVVGVCVVAGWRLRASLRRGLAATRAPGLVAGLAWTLPLLTLTLYPPTLFDDVLYHLPFAQALWENGALRFLGDLRYPVFPLFQEILWSPLQAVRGPSGAMLLVLFETLSTAALLYSWARRRHSHGAGLAAAALWLGCPAVVLYGTAAFVASGLTLFVTAAFLCLDRYRESRRGRWLALAGLLAGAAAASKYFGLFFLGALLVAIVIVARRLAPAVLAAVTALVAAAPLYLWIASTTGNPVFPLFPEVFGFSEWSFYMPQRAAVERAEGIRPSAAERVRRLHRIPGRLARQAREAFAESGDDLVRLPLTLTVLPGERHGPPPYNPFLLLTLPLLALPGARRRGLGLPAGVVAAYAAFWWATFHEPRYLVAAVALACVPLGVATGAGLRRWRFLRRRHAAVLVALVLSGPGLAYALYRIAVLGPVPGDAAARERLLIERVHGYRTLAALESAVGDDYAVYAFGAPNLQHFARGRLLGDDFGPYRFSRVRPLLDDPAALRRQLGRWGADHLLLPARGVRGYRPIVERLKAARELRLIWEGPGGAVFALTPLSEPSPPHPLSQGERGS